jgi:hypothetical protein
MIYEPSKGLHFYGAITECKTEAKRLGLDSMIMRFNGIDVRVSVDSNSDDLATIYDLKRQLKKTQHELSEM